MLKKGFLYGVVDCKYASFKESRAITVIDISQLVLELFSTVKIVLRRQSFK